ncbi:hypothetical protein [Longimicrobium sp.]|uniref:hypothetical protein n=1 Tax=Longimicrobium sp. TaxID=2029185 RepID=UPI002E31C7FB|nr:hypothetical protein [Longimicrobium sp.]HEX6041764.1 hypothetical protein [Longimicrobium sp.]
MRIDMNAALRDLYTPAVASLAGITAPFSGVSRPLLIDVPASYHDAPVKLMIVGQQTRGWGGTCETVDDLTAFYTTFELGRTQRRSQFWQAAHTLHGALNPESLEGGFLWSNLVKVDQGGGRPRSPGLEDAVCGLDLLQGEIRVTRPDVVIFFTGPSYDGRLASTFPGVAFNRVSGNLFQLQHPALPAQSYRTYHPRYLRRSGRWKVLDEIATRCRAAA